MFRTRFFAAIALLFSTSFVRVSLQAAEPFRFPEAKHGKGELKYVNGLPVLIVQGSPEEIGEQTAVLAVKPAKRILGYPKELLERFRLDATWPLFVRAGGGMVTQFPSDYRKELEAMAKAGVERDPLVAGNTMFDIKRQFACSGLIVEPGRSATGKPLFGRNLDYPSLGWVQQYSLVTIYRPKGKHAFVAIGFPGLVGCLSGMNDAGLALAVHETSMVNDGTARFNAAGIPYALCYRRILEECTTVAEAEKLLRSMKRTTITNLAICDQDGGAVFEVTPKDVIVRRPVDGICSCTNHFCTKELKVPRQLNIFRTLDRYDTLESSRRLPRIGLPEIQKKLAAVSVQDHTLQTMVFEPASLKLHLSIGKCPSAGEELKLLDLRPWFQAPQQR